MRNKLSKLIMIALLATSMPAIIGCGHEHTWTEATCDTPKTCAECGEIEGEVLEHVWVDATYTNPKTCELCGTTEGTSIPVCVEKKFSHKSDPVYNSKFEYDAEGKKIKEVQYKAEDGSLYGEISFEYDVDGNLVKEEGDYWIYTYEYDENGNLIAQNTELKDFSTKTIFEYDADGKKISGHEKGERLGEEFTREYTFEYDADGKLVKKIWYWQDGTVTTTEYEYDADGNLIKEEYTEGSEELGWEWVEISEYTYAPLN